MAPRIMLAIPGVFLLLVAPLPAFAQVAQPWWQRAGAFRTRYYNVKTDLPTEQAQELARHMDVTAQAYAAIFAGLRMSPGGDPGCLSVREPTRLPVDGQHSVRR